LSRLGRKWAQTTSARNLPAPLAAFGATMKCPFDPVAATCRCWQAACRNSLATNHGALPAQSTGIGELTLAAEQPQQ
jgi:hypothetical protein